MKRPTKAKKGEALDSFFLQQILDFSLVAFILVDEEHKIQFVNEQTEELFGYPRQDLIGRNISILIPDRFHVKHIKHEKGYLKQPRKRVMGNQDDITGRHHDGREIPLEIGLNPVEIDSKTYTLASITNITVQKAFEQSNQDNSRRYHNLFENSLDAILIVDDEQKYVDANPAACEMLGYAKEELLNLHI